MSKTLLKGEFFRDHNALYNRVSTLERSTRVVGPGEGETLVGFPPGGTKGQSLVKSSNANYETEWKTITGGGKESTGIAPIKVIEGIKYEISLEEGKVATKYLETHAVTEEKLAEALLGPIASHFGLRKIGSGKLEAMAGIGPEGGSAGQALVRKGTEELEWKTISGGSLPSGGEVGQPLVRGAEAEKGEWLGKITGGAKASGTLTLESTSHATKGKLLFGTSAYDEVNNRLGVGTASPAATLHVEGKQPAEVNAAKGTEAPATINLVGATGGNTSKTTEATGGKGSNLIMASGTGGLAAKIKAEERSEGGPGGLMVLSSGVGGAASVAGAENVGGTGGNYQLVSGNGGVAEGVTTFLQEGGTGGQFQLVGGAGGVAKKGTGENAGGFGGGVKVEAGNGGAAENGSSNTGGEGGSVTIKVGAGGAGSTKTGAEGTIKLEGPVEATSQNIAVMTAGKGFRVKEGSNAKMGITTLVGGKSIIANTSVTASSRIFLTNQKAGGTVGTMYEIENLVAGKEFTIHSTNVLDTSQIAWIIFEPA